MRADTGYSGCGSSVVTLQQLKDHRSDDLETFGYTSVKGVHAVTFARRSKKEVSSERVRFPGKGNVLGHGETKARMPEEKAVKARSIVKVTTDMLSVLVSCPVKAARAFGRGVVFIINPVTYITGLQNVNSKVGKAGANLWSQREDGNIAWRAAVNVSVLGIVVAVKLSGFVVNKLKKCLTNPMAMTTSLGWFLGYDISFLKDHHRYDTAGKYVLGTHGVAASVNMDKCIAGRTNRRAEKLVFKMIKNQFL